LVIPSAQKLIFFPAFCRIR